MFMKTDRDRQRQTCRWPLAGLLPLAPVLAGFAVFAVFTVCTPFAFRRSASVAACSLQLQAACSVQRAACRVPCAECSWLLPDFVDDASPVKLRTAQPGSRHIGLCIAWLLEFIYLELASVSKYFAEAPGCVALFTKFVDGVHSVNVACTHDFEFLDDVNRLWLRRQKI